jgi:hypothetical protein
MSIEATTKMSITNLRSTNSNTGSRKPNRNARRAIERASSCAFEQLEGRRLMKAPVELPDLPALPTGPEKLPVETQPNNTPTNWRRPTTPIYFEGAPGTEPDHGHEHEGEEHEGLQPDPGNGGGVYAPEFVLNGKWGQPGGLGTAVPLTYSYSNAFGALGALSNATISSSIEEALQLWSAVAPLRFTQVADAGPLPTAADPSYGTAGVPNLRFGRHTFDGPSNVLAHAYYPQGTGLSGDTHFDQAESWNTDPDLGIDLIEVATHEIGHAIGLAHQASSTTAVMNPIYGSRFDGPGTGFLLADDIAGAQANYGAGFGYVLNSSGTLYLSGTEGNNVITLSVSGGTITGSSSGFGSFTRSTAGVSQIVINGRGGNDIIRIESNGGIATRVNGGDGNEFVDFSFGARDLDLIDGNVDVYGGAGTDGIFVYDQNNASAATYTVTSARFDRAGWGGFFYASDIESETMWTGTQADTVNVPSTYPNQPVYLNSSGGNDVVNVGNSTNGVQSIRASVRADNTPAFTTLNISDAANAAARSAEIDVSGSYTYVFNLAPAWIGTNNSDTAAINITTGTGADDIDVARNSETVNLNSAGGLDTVDIGQVGTGGVQSVFGQITVQNSPSYTTLSVNDTGNAAARTATIDTTLVGGLNYGRITGLAPATILYKHADISWTNPVRVTGGSGADAITVLDTLGSRHLHLSGGPGSDTLRVDGTQATGPVTVLPSSGLDDVLVNHDAAGTAHAIFDATHRLGTLSVRNGGNLRVTPGANKVVTTTLLNISGNGQLDLADNDMVVDYSGASQLASVQTWLTNGYNGGAWNGTSGISNSAATPTTGLGFAEASEVFLSFPATFSGVAVDNTSVLIKHTFYGDANLDGQVNLADFNKLASNFGQSGRRWAHGDANFDGQVNLFDFNKLASNFGSVGMSPEMRGELEEELLRGSDGLAELA